MPFKKFTLKTGVKYAEVTNDNQYRFDSLRSGNFVEIEAMSNHFKYKERITRFSVNDVLNTYRNRAYSLSDIADYYHNDKPYSRIIGLSFKYHFGGELIKSHHQKTEEQEKL